MRQLGAHLLARRVVERLHLVRAAARRHPRERQRPCLRKAGLRRGVGVDQLFDVGRRQPEIGERVEALAGRDGLCEEDAVDPARAGACNDVGEHADLERALCLDLFEQLAIDGLARRAAVTAGMMTLARADEVPDLLGDAVHVDGEADAAIADEREAEFFFAHRSAADRLLAWSCGRGHAGSSVAQIGR